jgi:hypothetical protein
MSRETQTTARFPASAVKSAGGFSDLFLSIASSRDDADSMQYSVTKFGLQGTFQIEPETRKVEMPEWFEDSKHGPKTAQPRRAMERITHVTLNKPCGQSDLRKIVDIGHQSPNAYDVDLIESLMTIQAWQQNRADEEECHLPLKFVAFDESVPAAFASLDIHMRDQPQALATYVLCSVDMLVIDARKPDEGFDLDLSIACTKCVSDTLGKIYRTLPENRTVVTDICAEWDNEEERLFAKHISDAIFNAWEQANTDEQIAKKRSVLEKP